MTGANMNFMQPVTASYTGNDFDGGFVPSFIVPVTALGINGETKLPFLMKAGN